MSRRIFFDLSQIVLGILLYPIQQEVWGDTPVIPKLSLFVGGILVGYGIRQFFARTFLSATMDDRSDLPGFRSELKHTNEAWALWRVATHLRNSQEIRLPQWKRIVLIDPNPSNQFLDVMTKDDERPRSDLEHNIKQTTREALKGEACDVRWFTGVLSETMVIARPNSKLFGWIRLESGLPIPGGEGRSQRYIYQLFSRKLFNSLRDYYESIWKDENRTRIPADNDL